MYMTCTKKKIPKQWRIKAWITYMTREDKYEYGELYSRDDKHTGSWYHIHTDNSLEEQTFKYLILRTLGYKNKW